MGTLLLGLVVGASLQWLFVLFWGDPPNRAGRNSNGNCEPMPPAPPYSSTAIAWQAAEAQRAIDTSARIKHAAELYAKFIDPSLGVPWDEGHTQRGNGNGGPTVPKPGIIPKPQPPGGRLIREGQWLGGYQPRPQGGTTNPPPEAP